MAEGKKSNKGLIIGIVLALGFVLLTCAGGGIFAAYKYYWQPLAEAKKNAEAMAEATPEIPLETPADPMPEVTEAPPEAETTEGMVDATAEPTPEADAPTAAPTTAPKKTKTPKTAAPATASPTDEPTEAPKPVKARKAEFEISHVHGGLSKKTCTGMIELLDTGFKYEATASEDDRHQASYTFSQIKKVEQKDYKTIEISTTDKKWTFKGEGLTIAKLTTHLNSHQNEFAGK
jgi:outer membrane biosynthesis protein TonB